MTSTAFKAKSTRNLIDLNFRITFCDLAGVERASKTHAEGSLFIEACHINKSLLALKKCLNGMIECRKKNKKIHVPYRDYKLTRLFQAYFEGHGYINMIANISPSKLTFDENLAVGLVIVDPTKRSSRRSNIRRKTLYTVNLIQSTFK